MQNINYIALRTQKALQKALLIYHAVAKGWVSLLVMPLRRSVIFLPKGSSLGRIVKWSLMNILVVLAVALVAAVGVVFVVLAVLVAVALVEIGGDGVPVRRLWRCG